MNTKSNNKVKKVIEVDADFVITSFNRRLNSYGIIPKYVSVVGREVRIGIASSAIYAASFYGNLKASTWAEKLADTAGIIIENLTYCTRDQDDHFVYGKIRRMKTKKVDTEFGDCYYLTEFRFKVVR